MTLFNTGIKITEIEHKSLLHMVADPETWLLSAIMEKARLRRNALIEAWRTKLFADPDVTELPADDHELCALIMARDDYKSRAATDAAHDPPEFPDNDNIRRYEAVSRSGTTVTLFSSGINLDDVDANCILAYVPDLNDWVLGALLGQINRGKKLMLREWQPIILADPDISTMPATEEGLINMIVNRDDYQAR